MDQPLSFFRATEDGLVLFVRLTPKAAEDSVEGVGKAADGRQVLKARVRAAPEKGKANLALEKLVAKWLRVPARDVSVVRGATSRLKTLAVKGDPQVLVRRLLAAE